MKILQDTPDRLVIEDRPVVLAWILVGMIVATAAASLWLLTEGDWTGLWLSLAPAGFALAFVVFVVRVQATFDRSAGVITIETSSLRRRMNDVVPLAEVRRADVQTYLSKMSGPGRKETKMSRPVLQIEGAPDPRPVMETYTAGSGAAEAAGAINRWLDQARAA